MPAQRDYRAWFRLLIGVILLLAASPLLAHTIEGSDAAFVQNIDGPAIGPFIYLGAKHMVTGYDHLLFLVGVIFFLYRPGHIVQYVTLFAIGHSITLLFGVLADLQVNAYFIDAIIGLSVAYKAFENMGGFRRLGFEPNTRMAVFVFGLFHGLGLATKLQEFELSDNGLVTNILSFNVGVEIGQILALSLVYIGLSVWRTRDSYLRNAFVTNTVLLGSGFLLTAYQLSAFVYLP
ncbi:MAG: HupE/UreJ family protein [Gammaproteobacteria bacterium]|nr:HupE/UreJ family protein [Gammaproteobacteria bacterium]MYA35196.1 HupE/UreJ family protein [Gammaproteobacteria bacterium]MYA67348.1 HupE/UreJ family protein [Gammaproteobacteria bacterium]MYH46520.1 HupE/UreJ family protein [Gammaproteobacteria bacterium]MYH85749.1 HupE/UreJ family protein [Gammaproteobacteria bacterium]